MRIPAELAAPSLDPPTLAAPRPRFSSRPPPRRACPRDSAAALQFDQPQGDVPLRLRILLGPPITRLARRCARLGAEAGGWGRGLRPSSRRDWLGTRPPPEIGRRGGAVHA
jgi:hypothetical protein